MAATICQRLDFGKRLCIDEAERGEREQARFIAAAGGGKLGASAEHGEDDFADGRAVFRTGKAARTRPCVEDAIRRAAALVDEQPGRIVTFGIQPSYPAESFGYIERGMGDGSPSVYPVRSFREKPDAATARQFVESGEFYWNSGIFVWRARTILDALAEHQPAIHAGLVRIAAAFESPEAGEVLQREFEAMPSISIDYAVMEHAADVLVVEAPFEWDDVGSWQAIGRRAGADADGNTIDAKHLGVDTCGTIVRGPRDHLIVTLGLEDCIVVHTPDATLVANRHDEESVRRVVELLRDRGWTEYL